MAPVGQRHGAGRVQRQRAPPSLRHLGALPEQGGRMRRPLSASGRHISPGQARAVHVTWQQCLSDRCNNTLVCSSLAVRPRVCALSAFQVTQIGDLLGACACACLPIAGSLGRAHKTLRAWAPPFCPSEAGERTRARRRTSSWTRRSWCCARTTGRSRCCTCTTTRPPSSRAGGQRSTLRPAATSGSFARSTRPSMWPCACPPH